MVAGGCDGERGISFVEYLKEKREKKPMSNNAICWIEAL